MIESKIFKCKTCVVVVTVDPFTTRPWSGTQVEAIRHLFNIHDYLPGSLEQLLEMMQPEEDANSSH